MYVGINEGQKDIYQLKGICLYYITAPNPNFSGVLTSLLYGVNAKCLKTRRKINLNSQ